ncbi:MAG: nucleotidyltransferase family protein [Actinomycetota bacterium]|nr:nucleotidyltransferase family protein [Actinomycetota bacterium]
MAFAKLERGARCWQIDRWTAEVVTALRADGIHPVLLKGPATARWLYPDLADRPYCDIDLMVSPSQLAGAQQVLRRIGYAEPLHPKWLLPHARCWVRPADGSKVDLHRTLHCMEATPIEDVWEAVTTGAEKLVVGGISVDIPGPAVRALHLVLHLAPNEDPMSQASKDLRRAMEQVDRQAWQSAASLARRLGVDGDMGQRLCHTSDGAHLAHELGLPRVGSLRSSLISGTGRSEVSPRVYALWCLDSKTTLRAKVRWILQRQFPSRRFMEEVYPRARDGRFWLTASYLLRALESCTRVPGAVAEWNRFQRKLDRRSRVSG